MTALRLRAPAKINWTLEVLGKRPDGYHEVRTILQTIDLADSIILRPAEELSFSVGGKAAGRAIRAGWRRTPESNLPYRAAQLLRERTGCRYGAEIWLRKHIPVAAGLGGGSSDAAAVLRGLCPLWELSISDEELASIAAELGADVPFFLHGGVALASGRGEVVERLPAGRPQRLVLAWPPRGGGADKTARMYAALGPEHYTDGSRTQRLADKLRAGQPAGDDDLYNVFEGALAEVDPEAARAFEQAARLDVGRPHLAGSGPAFFVMLEERQPAEPIGEAFHRLGLRAVETRTRSAAEAVACEEW